MKQVVFAIALLAMASLTGCLNTEDSPVDENIDTTDDSTSDTTEDNSDTTDDTKDDAEKSISILGEHAKIIGSVKNGKSVSHKAIE